MKIKLENLDLKHAQRLKDCLNNEEVVKTLEGIKFPFSLEDAKGYINKSVANKDVFEYAIFYENNFVGTIVLENPDVKNKSYEIGYVIARPYWGKGIATEAVKEMMKIAFNKLKIKRVWAGIITNNPASGRVLEKAGFKEKQRKPQGKYEEVIYEKIHNSK